MNLIINLITLSIVVSIGILILNFLIYIQRYFKSKKYLKFIRYIPFIKYLFLFIIISYYITSQIFNSFIVGLIIELLLFIILKNTLENIFYSTIFKIKESDFKNYKYIINEKIGYVNSIELTSLSIKNKNEIFSIPFKEIFKFGYKKLEVSSKNNSFSLNFRIKENFKVKDFEKFLFTISYINFDNKPELILNNNILEIKLHEKNFSNKIGIYNEILNHNYIDEV